MKFLLGDTDENNDSCFPNLTFNERLWGFIICVAVGNSDSIQDIWSRSFLLAPSWVWPLEVLPSLLFCSPLATSYPSLGSNVWMQHWLFDWIQAAIQFDDRLKTQNHNNSVRLCPFRDPNLSHFVRQPPFSLRMPNSPNPLLHLVLCFLLPFRPRLHQILPEWDYPAFQRQLIYIFCGISWL